MNESQNSPATVIRGARVILEHEIVEADVCIADGRIAGIGAGLRGDRDMDARGMFLAPALIDVHGDAFERQIAPRPRVMFPLDVALLDTDRQLAANGIATAYHAVTFSWAPGLRGADKSRALVDTMAALSTRLTVDNRPQLRWETFALEAEHHIHDLLKGAARPALAFNDHMSMTMRCFDVPVQQRGFEHAPDYRLAAPDDPRLPARFGSDAQRAGEPVEAFFGRVKNIWARRSEVPDAIERVAKAARNLCAPMLSHDDACAETRAWYNGLGAHVAEFPMTLEAAEASHAAGGLNVFGAPNAVRGESHIGSLSAADMVEAGLCDVLASDYFYPAMLAAVARLDREKRAPRHRVWSLVSKGPARAMGLTDRGDIALGQRADLVLVECPDKGALAIRATYVAGRPAYRSMPLSA